MTRLSQFDLTVRSLGCTTSVGIIWTATVIIAQATLISAVLLADAATGVAKSPSLLTGHADAVYDVAFAPGGNLIASGSYDKTIKLWDRRKRNLLASLEGHQDQVFRIAFSPDGTTLATCSGDGTVILWDVETSSQRRVLCRQKYPVIAVAFTADGKRIATAGRRVQLWDVEHGNQVWGLSDRESYFSIAFSPDQKSLAYGTNGLIRLCDVASAEPTGKLLAEKGMVYQLDYSPNGKWLAAATSDGTLTLWDTTQQSRRKWVAADQSALFSATFSSDGKYLASGGRERVIRIWTVPALELVDEFYGADETILSVKLSPDAQHLASGTYDGTIQYWDLETPLSSTEVSNTDQPAIPAPQSP